jgi:LysM repeat protein
MFTAQPDSFPHSTVTISCCPWRNKPSPKMKAAAFALFAIAILAPSLSFAQSPEARRIADLEQDVLQLKTQMGQMNLAMEALQRENAALRTRLDAGNNRATLVTTTQLDTQLANLRAELIRAQDAQKTEIVDEVSRQIERLAQQTQAALQAQAAQAAQAPAAAPAVQFSDNYPKTGISYTVQRGDTLSEIARRNNSTVEDIRNANQIVDPRRLTPGQVLFIPQRAAK